MTITIVSTITVTLKINVIFTSNCFSFDISLFYFIPKIILVKPGPKAASFFYPDPSFWYSSCLVQYIFFWEKGISSVLIYNRSNLSISVRIVLQNYKFLRNFNEKAFHERCFFGKYRNYPEKQSHTTYSYLLNVPLFSQFWIIDTIIFFQCLVNLI